jgi:uncharacterized SAM-binding protein YcdF (DUF218 family)
MAFELVKLIGGLLMPVPLILMLIIFSLILLAATTNRRLALVTLAAGTALLLLLSVAPLSERALMNLEQSYPVLHDPPRADWIIVLGGGSRYNKSIPPASCLGESSLYRLAEGVRLAKRLPDARLITSGAGPADQHPGSAELMAEVAADWGIDPARIITLTTPRNTEQEARAAARRINEQDTVILVTSASHMRRAKALFNGQGLGVIPAPAGHLVDSQRTNRHIGHHLPQAKYIGFAETALWEHIGLLWAKLRGKTD